MAEGCNPRLGIGRPHGRGCEWDRAWSACDESDDGTDKFLRLHGMTAAEPVGDVKSGSGDTALAAACWRRSMDRQPGVGSATCRERPPEALRCRVHLCR